MYLFAIGSYLSGKEPSFVYLLQQPFKILNFELRAFDERHQLLLHQDIAVLLGRDSTVSKDRDVESEVVPCCGILSLTLEIV